MIPEGYRKVAQNDSAIGDAVVAAFHNPKTNQYYVEVQVVVGDKFVPTFIGPIPVHAFDSMCFLLADVASMDKKFFYLS